MKVLSLISIILIFSFSYQETTEDGTITYTYDETNKLLSVTLPSSCPYLYILIDESEKAIRVRKNSTDSTKNILNDIHVQRDNSTYEHNYEMGIMTDGVQNFIFDFNKEFHDSEDFKDVKAASIEKWPCFKKMHCSNDNYYEYNSNRDSETKYRPGYHHTPFMGWMNDPNGLVYEDIDQTESNPGYYHLFYQFNPYSSSWDNMHWGHSKTKDLLTWIHLPPAFYRFSKGHIFSGSVVYDKNSTSLNANNKKRLIAYFTVWRKYEYNNVVYEFQHNYAGYSSVDGSTDSFSMFNYSENLGKIGIQYINESNVINPILIPEEEIEYYANNSDGTFTSYLTSSSFYNNYRDPKIVLYKDDTNSTEFYVLLLSADIEYRIYQNNNKDFVTWSLVGRFGEDYGVEKQYMQYECPDIARIFPSGSSHAKWVFIANINPGGPFGGSATEYFTGDFDGATYTSDHVYAKWMDFGKDHYATVTFTNIPNEERVLALPWTSNWVYSGLTPTFQFRSTNGLGRELSLFKANGEYFLNVAPAREVEKLKTGNEVNISGTVSKKKKKQNNQDDLPSNGMFELNIEITVTGNPKKYGFTLFNENSGEKVDFFFDTKKDKLWNKYGLANSGSFIMDRRYSGDHNFLLNGEKNWGTHGREKRIGGKDGVYAYTKNCYKYVDPFRLGTKIPMALLKNNKKHNVQIFYDKSHIEVFLDGGRAVMTNIVFPNGNYYNKLKFYTDKGTVKFEGKAYELQSTLGRTTPLT